MNTTDIMTNPAFTPVLFQIERQILESVRAARAEGLDFNDSQIRSTLNKVRKTSEGGKPAIPGASPRDQALARLHDDLLKARQTIALEDAEGNREPLPTKIWILCLRTVEESIQRYSTGPGSHGYQDFIEVFIGKKR
jgi:hypothetical protein